MTRARRSGYGYEVTAREAKQRIWQAADGPHVDVRGLPPPEPMRLILSVLAELGDADGVAVTVHHERDPVFLYPELHERGWQAETVPGEPGEIRLRISRSAE